MLYLTIIYIEIKLSEVQAQKCVIVCLFFSVDRVT